MRNISEIKKVNDKDLYQEKLERKTKVENRKRKIPSISEYKKKKR